jgi:DNA-nicking Smr family endonuclease
MNDDSQRDADLPVELPFNGELDLHTFRPQEVKDAVVCYLEECRARGILEVRVVHGKGIGQLRQTVHAILGRLPYVSAFSMATELYGGAGATIVHLRPLPRDSTSSRAAENPTSQAGSEPPSSCG